MCFLPRTVSFRRARSGTLGRDRRGDGGNRCAVDGGRRRVHCPLQARGMIFGSSRKVGGANKCLGEAPKSCTRKEHESATNSIAKKGQGAIAPCRVKGQRPLWGLGQRPNCSAGDQFKGRSQQRRRQRSVPASNFALPQERPSSRFINHLHIVAPDGRDRPASGEVVSRCWSFLLQGDFASAEATRGLCGRPLYSFALHSHVS